MKKVLNCLSTIWKYINRIILLIIFKIYYRIVYRYKVVGKKNIPKDGPLLFCGNHQSFLDVPLVIISSPRSMRFMAKSEFKSNGLISYLIYIYDAILVNRDSKDIDALKKALKELKKGGCIAIFPEGTRNGFKKNNGKMKNGATYLSLKTGAKIVPFGIKGVAKDVFKQVKISYGKPIDFSYLLKDGKTIKEVEDEATEILKEEIIKLSK